MRACDQAEVVLLQELCCHIRTKEMTNAPVTLRETNLVARVRPDEVDHWVVLLVLIIIQAYLPVSFNSLDFFYRWRLSCNSAIDAEYLALNYCCKRE